MDLSGQRRRYLKRQSVRDSVGRKTEARSVGNNCLVEHRCRAGETGDKTGGNGEPLRVLIMADIEAEYECPHCGQGLVMGGNAVYADDVEDECARQCDSCKGWYQLVCESVEVYLVATKAAYAQEDQG